jgi:hypothetical protein
MAKLAAATAQDSAYGLWSIVRKLSKTMASGDGAGKEQDNMAESRPLLGSLC